MCTAVIILVGILTMSKIYPMRGKVNNEHDSLACYKDTRRKPRESKLEGMENMRQREMLQFRTPQHPSSGTNNWGGASPMLARDVPKESLEQRYINLNYIRTRDEIFPVLDHDFFKSLTEKESQCPPTPSRRRGILFRFMFRQKLKSAQLGSPKKKKRWFAKMDHKTRWPQGWC
ncbi:hypothetical protein AgCh_038798 [Apium graveolens]